MIADHLAWIAELDHLEMLQEKLNTYRAFVEGGQLLTAYPKAVGKGVQIEIRFLHEPPQHA